MAVTKKSISATLKAVGGEDADAPYGSVEGVANKYEVDRYDELVLPTAFAASFAKFMKNPVLSFGHGIDGNPVNGTLPAGSVIKMDQDADGSTTFKARWANTPDAQKVRQLYVDGDMRAFSVQFITLESRDPTADEVKKFPGVRRVITALDLIEIACAVVPVNAGSLATAAKSLDTTGGLKAPRALPPMKEKNMKGTSILTSAQKDAVAGAHKAYAAHAEALDTVAKHLSVLGAAADSGDEGTHAATAADCMKSFDGTADTHEKLKKACKDMADAIGVADDPTDEADKADPDTDDANAGSPPLNEDSMKAFAAKFAAALTADKK